jgi:hypothetical protein
MSEDPETVAVHPDDRAWIKKEAAKRGISEEEVVSRLRRGSASRPGSPMEPATVMPPMPQGSEGGMAQAAWLMMATQQMNQGRRDDAIEMLRDEIRELKTKLDSGGGTGRRRLDVQEIVAMSVEAEMAGNVLSALRGKKGDDDNPLLKQVQQQMEEYRADLKEQMARTAEAEDRTRQLEADKQNAEEIARHKELEAKFNDLVASVSHLGAEMESRRNTPNAPPESEFARVERFLDEATRVGEKLDKFRGTGRGTPDVWDRVERMVKMGTDAFAKGGETIAKVEAAKHGVPPEADAAASAKESQGDYIEVDQAGPATTPAQELASLRAQVDQLRQEGFECDPTNPSTWPNITYTRTVNGRPVSVSRGQFVLEFGHFLSPRVAAAAPRPPPTAGASPLPLAPPWPVPAPPTAVAPPPAPPAARASSPPEPQARATPVPDEEQSNGSEIVIDGDGNDLIVDG